MKCYQVYRDIEPTFDEGVELQEDTASLASVPLSRKAEAHDWKDRQSQNRMDSGEGRAANAKGSAGQTVGRA